TRIAVAASTSALLLSTLDTVVLLTRARRATSAIVTRIRPPGEPSLCSQGTRLERRCDRCEIDQVSADNRFGRASPLVVGGLPAVRSDVDSDRSCPVSDMAGVCRITVYTAADGSKLTAA